MARLSSFRLRRVVPRGLLAVVFTAQILHAQRQDLARQIAADRALLAKETYVTPPPRSRSWLQHRATRTYRSRL